MPHRHVLHIALIGLLALACSRIPSADDSAVSCQILNRVNSNVEWRQGYCQDERVQSFIVSAVSDELTADSAIQIALLNNPQIQAFFEEIGIAQADLVDAGLLSNPAFEIEVRYPHIKGLKTNIEYLLTTSLLDIFLIPLRTKLAEVEFEQAQLKVSHEILDLAFDVRETYYELIAEKQKITQIRCLVELASISSEISSKQKAVGNINTLDFQLAQSRFLEAQLMLSQSQAEMIRLSEKFNRLLGFECDLCLILPAMLPEDLDYQGFDLCALESIAVEERLDLQVARLELSRLSRMLGLEDWWTFTKLRGGLAGERDPDGTNLIGPGFSGELPIFNYGQAARLRLFAELRKAQDHLAELEIRVRSEVREAHKLLISYLQIVNDFKTRLLPMQGKISASSEELYNVMGLGVDKLLENKRLEVVAQKNYTESLKKTLVSRVKLDRALGGNLFKLVAERVKPRDQDSSKHLQPQTKSEAPQTKNEMEKKQEQPHNNLRYNPVITPNVGSLPWTMDGGVKVFHLVAEPIRREFAPGFWVNCWGYNGSTPGPTIEAVEGDKVRILVTNKLNEATSVHWHGIILPNGMDGVAGLTQRAIPPGETFKYEFTLKQNGTFMYHPHADEMVQVALGMMGFFIIHPKGGDDAPIDRDFAIFLHEWHIPMGAQTPIPFEMLDFNIFTFNSVLFPKTESLVAKLGERVRIRLGNVMMNSHPIHLHGYEFLVTRKGGKRLPPLAQCSEVTVSVAPGETRDIEFVADNPGDWAFHCHKSHHIMNQMQHDMPNLIGIDKGGLDERIKKIFPEFMGLMNVNGMGEMFDMYGSHRMEMHDKMHFPANLSPIGSPGPFGVIEMGGMFTVFKVREDLTSYDDPGWYQHPPGTVAESINENQKVIK